MPCGLLRAQQEKLIRVVLIGVEEPALSLSKDPFPATFFLVSAPLEIATD